MQGHVAFSNLGFGNVFPDTFTNLVPRISQTLRVAKEEPGIPVSPGCDLFVQAKQSEYGPNRSMHGGVGRFEMAEVCIDKEFTHYLGRELEHVVVHVPRSFAILQLIKYGES